MHSGCKRGAPFCLWLVDPRLGEGGGHEEERPEPGAMPKRVHRPSEMEVIDLQGDDSFAADRGASRPDGGGRQRKSAPTRGMEVVTLLSPPGEGRRNGANLAMPSEDDVLASFICALPGCSRPCLVDKRAGVVHDYCCREHERQARLRGVPRAEEPDDHVDGLAVDVDVDVDAGALPTFECALPGCANAAAVDYSIGLVHDYCCKEHYLEAMARAQGLSRGESDDDLYYPGHGPLPGRPHTGPVRQNGRDPFSSG